MLRDRPKPAICNKRRGLLSKTAFLHHDNARPCVTVTTAETIRNFKFEVLSHPPYSPDLIPCDFHALSPLREALRCQWFGCDEEVKEAIRTWIREQPKTFFSDGIRKLSDCYKSFVELPGDGLKNNVTIMYMSLFFVAGKRILPLLFD